MPVRAFCRGPSPRNPPPPTELASGSRSPAWRHAPRLPSARTLTMSSSPGSGTGRRCCSLSLSSFTAASPTPATAAVTTLPTTLWGSFWQTSSTVCGKAGHSLPTGRAPPPPPSLTHIDEGQGSGAAARVDAKHILELGDEDMHRGGCGVATDQGLRQVGHHEAEVDQAQPHLWGGGQSGWRGPGGCWSRAQGGRERGMGAGTQWGGRPDCSAPGRGRPGH